MPLADAIREALGSQLTIRRMFEDGIALKKQHGADNVFDFSIGNPDVPPPPEFYKVLQKLVWEEEKGVHGYMPNAGFTAVREAVAKKVSAEQGVALDGSHLVMSCGAAGGLNVVLKAILNPGDEVIVPKPYFVEYRPYVANFGGRLIEVESSADFDLDSRAIKAALSPKTKAVIINSPHNPTGRVYSATSLAALAEVLDAHGRTHGHAPYLIADEPYREIVYDGLEVPPVLSAYSQSIVVNSYSKNLSLPGERIGYIAVSPAIDSRQELVNAFIYTTRILGFVNAPALMQRVVAELSSAQTDVEVYARRRALFTAILDEAGINYARPEGAFFLFCQVPNGAGAAVSSDYAFTEHLRNNLILGVPGSLFAMPGWVRFAYCVDEKIIAASRTAFVKAVADWKQAG
ncbi:MAG: pyridoxal phosphate-dependent aminotransferase [Treponema sp.]|nr:pyridoxal phosphate-dependent aminotransferase [Treponema sp.]